MSENIKPELHSPGVTTEGTRVRSKRRRRRHHRRWRSLRKLSKQLLPVFILLLTLSVIAGVLIAVLIRNAMVEVQSAQSRLDSALNRLSQSPATELSLADFDNVTDSVRNLHSALVQLNSRTSRFQRFAYLSGRDMEVQIEMMQASIHLTAGANYFLNGIEPTMVLLQRDRISGSGDTISTANQGRRIVDAMDAGQGQFLRARSEISQAQVILDGIDLSGVSGDLLLDMNDLQEFVDEVQSYNDLALEAPELLVSALGIEESQTYLILAQNNDEIRPSGGYISTWGWIRVRSGRIQDQDYFPTTINSPSPPPASVAESFVVPTWWGSYQEPVYAAWDGSWHADFSETAALAVWYYNNGNNPARPVDGAFGVDLIAVEYLIEALGEVYVPDYNRTIDVETFRAAIYEIRAERSEVALDHKRFVAAMFGAIVDKWQDVDLETQSAVNRAFLQALREKHIMLYFTNRTVQTAVEELDWAGTQAETYDYDYLMVAEANIRANKSSSSIYREYSYAVEIDESGTVSSEMSIFYDFASSVAEDDPAFAPEHYGFNKDYGALIQVFAPLGSEFISGSVNGDTTINVIEQPSYTVMVDTLDILYDESAEVQLFYNDAYQIESVGSYQKYRLLIQKQPGTRNDPVRVTVSLPPGAQVLSVSPNPGAQYNLGRPVYEFNLTLRQDDWVEIVYE